MALQIAVSKQPNVPLINGRGYSHQSISFKINGIEYKYGLVSINYKTGLKQQPLKSTAMRPVAYTAGAAEESGDCELFNQWGKALLAQLGAGYGVKTATIIVQRSETDDGGSDDTQTDTLTATFSELDQSSSGDNPHTMKFTLTVKSVKVNGIDIVPQGR